ncbi:beta-N-acetylhexosaminidase [Haloimpatiens sp. FM7330]|uniref:beta-N-acetylhexosaminidase n=1 Tax=Haloimpatiens sp. FM7330 TaxID=3298610 RepID=UPI0036279128
MKGKVMRRWDILLIVSISFLLIGCTIQGEKKNSSNSGKKNLKLVQKFNKKSLDDNEKEKNLIYNQIKNMSLDEKIGQMFILGFEGYERNQEIENIIVNKKIGGMIFFQNNIKNTEQFLNIVNNIKNTNKQNKIPLFLSIDQEGGRVKRLPKEIKQFPSSYYIGSKNSTEYCFKAGKTTANQLKAFGLNMNFAPVLDIFSNPKNTVIGDRAFGKNPGIVKELSIPNMKGMQSEGIISVVKHFPGHGDTREDSHLKLPIINHDLSRLDKFELVPFKAAIENNCDAVMVAHILIPHLDKNNPSSLSKSVVTDLLRKKLGFDGVVITDDINMGAISKNYGIEKAAVKAVEAGCDLVLICRNYTQQLKAIEELKNVVKQGKITEKRIDESVYRILKLKNKYNLNNSVINSVDVNKLNKEFMKQ